MAQHVIVLETEEINPDVVHEDLCKTLHENAIPEVDYKDITIADGTKKDAHSFVQGVLNWADEYATEAEHQEGEGYWEDNFDNVDQMVTDFALYLKCALLDKED